MADGLVVPEEILIRSGMCFPYSDDDDYSLDDPEKYAMFEWRNAKQAMKEYATAKINELYEQIKHGDQEHQDWLKTKIVEFIKCI